MPDGYFLLRQGYVGQVGGQDGGLAPFVMSARRSRLRADEGVSKDEYENLFVGLSLDTFNSLFELR